MTRSSRLPDGAVASEQIRALGRRCGFDTVGFARAEPVREEAAARFRTYLDEGRHAGMKYLEGRIEERLDPTRLLPEARTVIVVLLNYHRNNPTAAEPVGKIARYAGGRDYHKVMRARLEALKKGLEELYPGTRTWHSADTAPVLERYWAERAGVGWVGKNTLLITRGLGSWTFIGVLLTSLEIPPDAQHADHCGGCRRCLEACPTSALLAPGVLDSKRCISYWTIEHRGELPVGADLHGWVFGCDDCQSVCPWNRFARPTAVSEFELRANLCTPDLVRWAALSRAEWDELTRGTALRRAGYEGWRRNCELQE